MGFPEGLETEGAAGMLDGGNVRGTWEGILESILTRLEGTDEGAALLVGDRVILAGVPVKELGLSDGFVDGDWAFAGK
jgi:hypothetical protein